MKSEPRFIYASFRTRERAEAALEDMFAAGDVSLSERPLIQFISGRYRITLPM